MHAVRSWLCTQLNDVTCQFITNSVNVWITWMFLTVWKTKTKHFNFGFKALNFTYPLHLWVYCFYINYHLFTYSIDSLLKPCMGLKMSIIYAGKCLWGASHKILYYRSEANLQKLRFKRDFRQTCAHLKHVEDDFCEEMLVLFETSAGYAVFKVINILALKCIY